MDTIFRKIVIIGYGKIASEILKYVYKQQKKFEYQLEFVEHEVWPLNITEKICRRNNIAFVRIIDKQKLVQYFNDLQVKSLIISANNNFLFPERLIKKENITIINFHNALLPRFPGRNAPTWAIYMGEKETGITWHYVSEDIDGGNIITQKSILVGTDVKAYELAESLMRLAFESFREIFQGLLTEIIIGKKQIFPSERKIYHSKEVPSGGVFDLTDSPEKIYRLLRSVDYGKNNIFPRLYTYYRGETVEILRYRKIDADEIVNEDFFLYLPLDGKAILKMKYRRVER